MSSKKAFSPQLVFGDCLYHSNRKQLSHGLCLFHCVYLLPTALVCRQSLFLLSLTFTASHTTFTRTLLGEANVVTCFLVPVAFWNLSTSLHDNLIITSCMSSKQALHGTWMMPSSAAFLSYSMVPLDYYCNGLWVPSFLILGQAFS